jgi:hypothetical protein
MLNTLKPQEEHVKYNILNPKPMKATPGNYQLPVEQTQDFWLNIWENKMSNLLEFHQIPQNKRQSLLETIRTYLKPYQQSPSCIPLEETTKFLKNANQENQVITTESLLFFYEKVKASPAHSCQIKDFINEKAALNKWLVKAAKTVV